MKGVQEKEAVFLLDERFLIDVTQFLHFVWASMRTIWKSGR